jgi:TRAP transporter TAXI family solute receptor
MPHFARAAIIPLLCLAIAACDQVNDVESTEAQTTSLLAAPDHSLTHLFIGTGSVQGVYFPIGGVICRLLNRHKERHRIRCSLESTGGSIYNLHELRAGNFDLVFAQSDWQFHAYHGTSTFEKAGPNQDLRAVFALEADPVILLVRQDSDIQQIDDLQQRSVSFGYTRSLQHRIMNDYLAVKGWNQDSFTAVIPMSDTRQLSQLCAGKIDSALLLSSSLTDHLATLDEQCKLRMVSIADESVDAVISKHPYYRTGLVPKGRYLNAPEDTRSFGLGATFVALESTSPKAIYHVVKEVVENFRDFKSLHPSLSELDKEELSNAGISIPLHPGAVRYYKEARLLN